MFNMGPGEIFMILMIFVLLFGAKRLPQLARGMGQGIKEFKNGIKEIEDSNQQTIN